MTNPTAVPAPRQPVAAAPHAGAAPLRVLFLVHNHPAFHPGGAEIYALELHRAMRRSGRFDSLLVAAAAGRNFPHHLRRPFFRVREDDPSELVWSVSGFDDFYFTSRDKRVYTQDLRSLLESFRPQVVHVQHTLGLGLEALAEVRRTLPEVPIVYTLHEFLLLCASRGILLRWGTEERCSGPSPWRCSQCFPHHSPEAFVLREEFVKAQLEMVDLFLAPSRFLLGKYRDWGLPGEKLRFHDYGRRAATAQISSAPDTRNFVFLGQTMRHKGILVLLEAVRLLVDGGRDDITVYIDGANMHFDGDAYIEKVQGMLAETRGRAVLRGPYAPDEVPGRLDDAAWVIVPSIWWENSPLVIQEAFLHGRPVICSDIGGMAEKVEHRVNGLHFRAGDPIHLAQVMREAAGNDELWRQLHGGIPEIFPLAEAIDELEGIYRELVHARRAAVVD